MGRAKNRPGLAWVALVVVAAIGSTPAAPIKRAMSPYSVSKINVTPTSPAPGQTVAIEADFGMDLPGTVATYFEIRDPGNGILGSQSWNNQVFAGGDARRYSWTFTLPANVTGGNYRVHAGVFTADWSSNLMWQEGIGAFHVPIAPGPGRSFYVDSKTGSDSNSGTSPAAPWESLSRVNDFPLLPGDSVHFRRGGDWTGRLQISSSGTPSSPITYKAYDVGAAPLIRNPGVDYDSAVSITGDWTVVQDFLLSDAHEAGVVIAAGAENNIVRDNEITATGTGVLMRGRFNRAERNFVHDLTMIVNDPDPLNDYGAVCFWIEAPDNEVAYNRGVNCRAHSHDFGYDGGFVEVWQSGDNSFIHHNYAEGTSGFFELGGGSDGSARGIKVAYNVIVNVTGLGGQTAVCFNTGSYRIAVSSFRFENNTFVSTNGRPGAYRVFGCRSDLSALELRNNIFYSDIQIADTGDFMRARNLYYMTRMVSGSGIGYRLGPLERIGNPLFVDLGSGLLRLLPMSPAIDTGTSLGYSADVVGAPVPQGFAPDLGAYESGGN